MDRRKIILAAALCTYSILALYLMPIPIARAVEYSTYDGPFFTVEYPKEWQISGKTTNFAFFDEKKAHYINISIGTNFSTIRIQNDYPTFPSGTFDGSTNHFLGTLKFKSYLIGSTKSNMTNTEQFELTQISNISMYDGPFFTVEYPAAWNVSEKPDDFSFFDESKVHFIDVNIGTSYSTIKIQNDYPTFVNGTFDNPTMHFLNTLKFKSYLISQVNTTTIRTETQGPTPKISNVTSPTGSSIKGNTTGWNRTFGGWGMDEGNSVQLASDGGYIIAGSTSSYGAGDKDVWLIKTDANGNEAWNKTFGGSGRDISNSVQLADNGGYIIVGSTNSTGAGDMDAWLIKTDSNGNRQWDKTFGGSGYDAAYSVQPTSDGGYIIVGDTYSYGAGNSDIWLIKTDSNGNRLWDRTFGGSGKEWGNSVQLTSDGGYIIAGSTNSSGAGDMDAWLIKADPNGNKLWDKTFGGADDDEGYSVQPTSDGGYVIAGNTYTSGDEYSEAWLIKTDSNGNKLWDKTSGGDGWDEVYSVQLTSDGDYILVGDTDYYTAWDTDAYLVKKDSNGNAIWDRTFGEFYDDEAHSVQATGDGGYILVGNTYSYGSGNSDVWLIKTDSNGNE